MTIFRPQDLHAYAAALLEAAGYTAAHAACTADVLIWANARGTDSHGVLRIPRYIEMVEQGTIDPQATPEVTTQTGAMAVLDAARAPGPPGMMAAMETAIGIAEQLGIGWCSARDITHAGAVGYFALQAAARGCVGIVMTASGPLMAYHGARVSGLSTNPISICAPASDLPLLLDMSTSTVALGKIMHARDTGARIPEGWAIDGDGQPATDPRDVKTLTPLGGPKGSGLSLMVEVLSSLLVSNPVISTALMGEKGSMNGAAVAVKIASFCDPAMFAAQTDILARSLRTLPTAPGTDEILMPGERGFRLSEERMSRGIPVAEGTLKRLAEVGDRFAIPCPTPIGTDDPPSARAG